MEYKETRGLANEYLLRAMKRLTEQIEKEEAPLPGDLAEKAKALAELSGAIRRPDVTALG